MGASRVVLPAEQSIHIVAKKQLRGGGAWLRGGNGIACFGLERASGTRADFNCGICSRMSGLQGALFIEICYQFP